MVPWRKKHWQQPDEMKPYGPGSATPEDAAADDIPSRYITPISTSVDPSGDYAVVLLATNEAPHLYADEAFCYRRDGRWYQASSGNGNQFYPPLGLYSLWEEAPEEATGARVEFQGQIYECPAAHGFYHFVAWGLSEEVFQANAAAWDEITADFPDPPEGENVIVAVGSAEESERAKQGMTALDDWYPRVVEFTYG